MNDEEEPANGGLFFMLPELRGHRWSGQGHTGGQIVGKVAVGNATVGTGGGLTSMQTGGHASGIGAAPLTHAGGQSGAAWVGVLIGRHAGGHPALAVGTGTVGETTMQTSGQGWVVAAGAGVCVIDGWGVFVRAPPAGVVAPLRGVGVASLTASSRSEAGGGPIDAPPPIPPSGPDAAAPPGGTAASAEVSDPSALSTPPASLAPSPN